MPSRNPPRRRAIFWFATVAAMAGAFCWLVAAPQRKPVREQIMLEGTPVVVEYEPAAGAKELMLPFYAGAKVGDSFLYRVRTKQGKRITYYASAVLTTPDAPEQVAQDYSARLPGKPKPELISDKDGKRYLLAVASAEEVRQVTIRLEGAGSRIELVRAFGKALPQKPLRPRTKQQRVT